MEHEVYSMELYGDGGTLKLYGQTAAACMVFRYVSGQKYNVMRNYVAFWVHDTHPLL